MLTAEVPIWFDRTDTHPGGACGAPVASDSVGPVGRAVAAIRIFWLGVQRGFGLLDIRVNPVVEVLGGRDAYCTTTKRRSTRMTISSASNTTH